MKRKQINIGKNIITIGSDFPDKISLFEHAVNTFFELHRNDLQQTAQSFDLDILLINELHDNLAETFTTFSKDKISTCMINIYHMHGNKTLIKSYEENIKLLGVSPSDNNMLLFTLLNELGLVLYNTIITKIELREEIYRNYESINLHDSSEIYNELNIECPLASDIYALANIKDVWVTLYATQYFLYYRNKLIANGVNLDGNNMTKERLNEIAEFISESYPNMSEAWSTEKGKIFLEILNEYFSK